MKTLLVFVFLFISSCGSQGPMEGVMQKPIPSSTNINKSGDVLAASGYEGIFQDGTVFIILVLLVFFVSLTLVYLIERFRIRR